MTVDLPYFWRRLNTVAWLRRRAARRAGWRRYIQAQRVLALHRGAMPELRK